MSIEIYISPINEGPELVKKLLQEEFNINEKDAEHLAQKAVKPHLDKLKPECYILAETNYIDKVYRDSYYHYYSSKLSKYKRDCFRLSIFEGEIDDNDFRQVDKVPELQKKYRGFIVIRPTEPSIIGRSVISPKALQSNTFLCCSTKIQTTVNSVKFEIDGFPHSSQDTETITCAETTLWAIMEYFGSKYPEYKPTLPSKIIQILNKVSTERQIPSKGLNIQQMSFALKEFGFGTRIYSRQAYGHDFDRLISCYVESGIPLILGIDNRPAGNIGHAMLCIGHENVQDGKIDLIPSNNNLSAMLLSSINARGIKIYDWDDIQKEFVFVDDNFPVYQKALLSSPTVHYSPAWHDCKIQHFIVPLYPKIYLEAYEAKNYILRFLVRGPKPLLPDNSEVLIRFFLSSSRSFKDSLALNSSFDAELRDMILEMPMPKFIWVAEITNKALIKAKQANGLVILDATEANISHKPLIFAGFAGRAISFDLTTGELEDKLLTLPPFSIYQGNLKNL
jgi:hypothetical protein